MSRRRLGASRLVLAAVCCAGCGGDGAPSPGAGSAGAPPVRTGEVFVDRAAEAGVGFVHVNGMTGDLHIAELMGAGAALADLDGDGDLDLYLVQGGPLGSGGAIRGSGTGAPAPYRPTRPSDRLYRNDTPPGGPVRFTDVTAAAGLPGELGRGYGMGVAAGDYDGDGLVDLYVTERGPNRLLRNRGDGRFDDVTEAAGAADPRWSVPATFFDYDRDGRLDLFVGNYLDYSDSDPPRCAGPSGARDYCAAARFPAQRDRLLRNRGDGTFEDATAAAGLATAAAGRALGAVAADLDGDGWPDLYVANDGSPNHLWINRGDGTFAEEAMLRGAAVNGDGSAEASMGIALGDPDADGDLDLVLTHLVVETNTFYRNDGGVFVDRSGPSGLGPPSRTHTGFGTGFVDFDGDGRLDLVAVDGAVQHIAELVAAGDPFPVHETNQLYRNLGPVGEGGTAGGGAGEPRFEEVSAGAGRAFAVSRVSRGAAFGDLDGDGDLDLMVTNNDGPAELLIAEGRPDPARWLGVRAVVDAGGGRLRDALGATVTLRLAGGGRRLARIAADGSYASASDPRALFTLAPGERPSGLEVRWPDGTRETFPPPPTGHYTTVHPTVK